MHAAIHTHHTKNALLEFSAAAILSIFALFVAVFSTDWILGNGKNSNIHTGHKDNARPGIYAYMDVMSELDRKRNQNGNKTDPPAMPPETDYRDSAQLVNDFERIMVALDNNGNNGKKSAPYENKNQK